MAYEKGDWVTLVGEVREVSPAVSWGCTHRICIGKDYDDDDINVYVSPKNIVGPATPPVQVGSKFEQGEVLCICGAMAWMLLDGCCTTYAVDDLTPCVTIVGVVG